MTRRHAVPAAPVGQQGPPARDAPQTGALRSRARVPPVDYGDGLQLP